TRTKTKTIFKNRGNSSESDISMRPIHRRDPTRATKVTRSEVSQGPPAPVNCSQLPKMKAPTEASPALRIRSNMLVLRHLDRSVLRCLLFDLHQASIRIARCGHEQPLRCGQL